MKIGLALSGGGVLGVAHLGVLRQLEENKINIDMACGVSAGAILGALYIDGGIKRIEEFLDNLEKKGLFAKKNLMLLGTSPEKIFSIVRSGLEDVLSAKKFYDLKTSFSVVTTDLIKGEAVIINNGNLIDAIMASSAFPGVFPVQTLNGRYLIDGGTSVNFPVNITRKMGADFVIGSQLFNISKLNKFDDNGCLKANRFEIVMRSIDIMQRKMAEYEMKKCDFCFHQPVEDYSWYHFNRMNEIRRAGEVYAASKINELIKIVDTDNKPKKTFWERILKV